MSAYSNMMSYFDNPMIIKRSFKLSIFDNCDVLIKYDLNWWCYLLITIYTFLKTFLQFGPMLLSNNVSMNYCKCYHHYSADNLVGIWHTFEVDGV